MSVDTAIGAMSYHGLHLYKACPEAITK